MPSFPPALPRAVVQPWAMVLGQWDLRQDGCRGERGAAPRSSVGVPSSLDG